MSWMDSWSRPTKGQATPAPYYLTHGDSVPYCHTCGRIIGARRANSSKAAATEVKYCSDKCKRHKPSNAEASLDRRIEEALSALLQGRGVKVPRPEDGDENGEGDGGDGKAEEVVVKARQQGRKGDPRVIVQLSELERAVFGDRIDPEKVYGRRKNRKARFVQETGEWKSVDMVDEPEAKPGNASENDEDTAGSLTDASLEDDSMMPGSGGVKLNDHVRAPQTKSDINFSAGGGERGWAEKIEETPEMLAKRREGQKRAEEKEIIRNVARRAIVFGVVVDAQPERGKSSKKSKKRKGEVAEEEPPTGGKVRRQCEALMHGQVVEPSFAKGDWEIRFRED